MTIEKKQIYIIDDDESVCRSLKILLMTFGFEVEVFFSAERFFCTVSNNRSGCLILDIHMPGLDGKATLNLINMSGSKRPVIIISADKDSTLKEEVLKIGALGFLEKPVNCQDLVKLINSTY